MITINAPAKINLFLDVIGKRHDGYHDIKSIVLPLSLADTIRIESRTGNISTVIAPYCSFKGIPWRFSMGAKNENLITRAAFLFKKCTACRKGAAISLTKRIPIGAGLGGGSSDAAAVLIGLNRLWKTGLSRNQLMEIGAQIGCDVPALIHGGAICMEGRGENITPIDDLVKNDLFMLLIYPGFAISTRDIYQRHDLLHEEGALRGYSASKFRLVTAGMTRGSMAMIGKGLYNTLQKTVFNKYPLLEIIKNSLENAGVKHIQLTGSGSTVFVLLKERDKGEQLAKLIRRQIGSPLWTQVVQTIGKRNQSG